MRRNNVITSNYLFVKMNKKIIKITFVAAISFLTLAILQSCQPQKAEFQNSQWRGEDRDGMYLNETGLLKEWSVDGPELLWHFEGLGAGYTSVAIANDKIYITGLTDDDLFLYVLDLNGTFLNKKLIGKEWTVNFVGSRCTVCVNEGKLYIGNALGQMFCLDEATLEEIWKVDLLNDYDGRNIRFGMTESPLIVGNKIFLTPGGENNNMIALNKNTGELIWSSPGDGTPSSWCSPQFIGNYSVPMVVTNMHEQIVAFNANTGEVVWSHPQKNSVSVHVNTPLYSDGMIFSSIGYRGGSMLLRLIDNGKNVEEVWKNDEMDNEMGGAVRVGDYVYASGHANRYWFCVDWKTGETLYSEPELAPSVVIYADGMLYVYSAKGEMALVKPNPEKLEIVSIFDVSMGTGEHWAHPVIDQGVLYIRHGDALMAYKVK